MAATPQSPRNALGICERRAQVRASVTPPIYVSLDNMNGGLVFNISEAGLALTAALDLADDDLLGLRIFLPDSKGWVEASGKIAWRGESEKEGGIRFVGLGEEARQRIREWLVAENLQVEAPREQEFFPNEELNRADDATASAPVFEEPLPANSSTVEEEHAPEPAFANDFSLVMEQSADPIAQPPKETAPGASENAGDAEDLRELVERRTHERCAIDTISYVRLGRENGGTLLNISEGGFAVRAAARVCEGDVATIRIQFTEEWDCLEVSGAIAWNNEAEKKAGIRFVSLTREARAKISKWLSQGEAGDESQEQGAENPEKQTAQAQRVTARGIGADRLAVTVGSLPKEFGKEIENKSKWAIFQLTLGQGTTKVWHLLAAVVLAEMTALVIVWTLAPHGFRQAVVGFIAKNGAVASEPTLQKAASSRNLTIAVPPVQAENAGSEVLGVEAKHEKGAVGSGPTQQKAASSRNPTIAVPPVQADNAGTEVHGVEAKPENNPVVRPPGNLTQAIVPQVQSIATAPNRRALEGTARVAESASEKNGLAAHANSADFTMPRPTVEPSRSQTAENPPAQLTSSTGNSAASSFTSTPNATELPIVSEKEAPAPPLQPPAAPVAPVWSVVVSTDPYPSIKVSRKKMNSRKPSGEGNLQIGKIISSAEPVYPEDAKHQGVGGTVNLHVVVGRDGTVQKVEAISGPAMLRKAAADAVRQWRYAKTLLDGQPVETEQDVVVNFRKVTPPIAQK
jgi:TonB family protein